MLFNFSSQEKSQADEFSELLRTYGDMAYRMAYQLTGGRPDEAGDLVQEVFLKIWRNWKTHQRPSSIKSWMYRVLHNLYIDAIRRRARAGAVALDAQNDSESSWENILPDPSPSADAMIERRDQQRRVTEALDQLEEDFRMPVILCDMEGLAYEDIARILQCPVGTVRSRIHRGRGQLRKHLELSESTEVMP